MKSARCYKCSKVGHLASVCQSRDARKKGKVHNLRICKSCEDATKDSEDEMGVYSLYSLDTNKPHLGKYSVEMIINGDGVSDKPLIPSKVKGKQCSLPIVLTNYDTRPTLRGRNWLFQVKIEWGEIFSISNENLVSAKSQFNDLLSKHSELFEESCEGMKGLEAQFSIHGRISLSKS